MEGNKTKIYVEVNVKFFPDGGMMPTEIIWEDGTRYEIDKVIDLRRAASLRAGGAGLRYTCMILGSPHYLFYEENQRWFVEAKNC